MALTILRRYPIDQKSKLTHEEISYSKDLIIDEQVHI